ncbi:hypothetical protein [Enterobacteriaceae endosymbiont of Donacia semicuprea]|uniref:CAF17-like 4Fe-4S cluster assembly/insertion protein YgfZ n=1 Tax=Enterobacteriaceae endosymbiont of Donacia semicuprea TaxID=2675783 RepID=UPI001449D659|nr:hypothetical protein [Enterobacteriaceae endosymbiont of Donacia semicuprea]QJC32857.1 hypothetical protein GJT91_00890 [Enterobacteriaceae endosymbiont of Donacia semicuprea]
MLNSKKSFNLNKKNDFNKKLKLINLSDLQLIIIKGPDNKIFLQNQLTININELDNNIKFFNALHCNSQGKVLINMYIYKDFDNNYQCIIKKNIVKKYLIDIKKYTLIYNIKIILNLKNNFFGLSGGNLENFMSKIFKSNDFFLKEKSLFFIKEYIILKFFNFSNYYFIILSKKSSNFFIKNFFIKNKINISNFNYWLKFNMEIGYPIIDNINNCNLFLPQQINMEKFNAINYNKGCYLGQEIISSFKFRNKKNKGLFLLEGKTNFVPLYNDLLEFKNNIINKWEIIKGSRILKSLKIKKNIIWIQVILKNNILKNSLIRFNKDKKNIFFIIKKFE